MSSGWTLARFVLAALISSALVLGRPWLAACCCADEMQQASEHSCCNEVDEASSSDPDQTAWSSPCLCIVATEFTVVDKVAEGIKSLSASGPGATATPTATDFLRHRSQLDSSGSITAIPPPTIVVLRNLRI